MKAILTGRIGREKAHLIIELTDEKLIDQAVKDKHLIVYTQEEIDALRGRLLSAIKMVDRLTTGNVSHIKGNLRMILMGGLK